MKLKYLLRIVLIGVILYLSAVYLDGITLLPIKYGIIPSFFVLLVIFSSVEILIYPIIKMLILPLRLITFGLASAVLSIGLVYAIAWLYPFFMISSFWQLLVFGAVLSIVRVLTK